MSHFWPNVYRKCNHFVWSNHLGILRYSQATNLAPKPSENPESPAKPFESIPGPKSYPLIGSIYNYLPGGQYYNTPLHIQGAIKYRKYGSLVRETFLPGKTVLWVFDPKDMETLFLSEFRHPARRSHLALKKFRNDRPHIYNDGGLLPTNGEEWWRLRREFQKGLSALPCVRSYLPTSDNIITNFVKNEMTPTSVIKTLDYLPLVSRLFLELIGVVAFDVDLNSFSTKELQEHSRSSRLLKAVETANSCILPLDNSENSWMKRETRKYKRFVKAMLVMEEVAVDLVQRKVDAIKSEGPKSKGADGEIPSLMEMYLTWPELDSKDVVGMALDLLLAGIDTTAYTSCYAMYHIARHQQVQQIILREACAVLGPPGSNNPITAEVLANIPYTRAVLKEVFRLSPISVGVGRVTTQDMVLSGYHIPAKTQVVTQNQVACQMEKNFPVALEFAPERWIKGHRMQATVNPYLALPFGHGPRACIARRLAEQHLLTLILRTIHNVNLTWAGKKPLGCKTGHINQPNVPVEFHCLKRRGKY